MTLPRRLLSMDHVGFNYKPIRRRVERKPGAGPLPRGHDLYNVNTTAGRFTTDISLLSLMPLGWTAPSGVCNKPEYYLILNCFRKTAGGVSHILAVDRRKL